jgi:ABC-type dipeptide/oligopeptide/nickel transport system permease subunit
MRVGVKAKKDPLYLFGLGFLSILILLAIFGPSIRNAMVRPPDQANFYSVYDPVGIPHQPAGGKYLLGTDEQGRDVLSRLAAGARVSLIVGFVVEIIALTVGITVGVLAVFAPRWVSMVLMRFTDGMFAFPDILLAVLIIGTLPPNAFAGPIAKLLPVIVALSVTAWPSIARLVKGQVATLKDREFVVGAKASGASTFYLVTRHILPQLTGILLAVSMIDIAGTILAESTLSFLGIGVQPPEASWGSMINSARQDMTSHPIALVWPCLILSLTIFSLNFIGDGLRAAFDPKTK